MKQTYNPWQVKAAALLYFLLAITVRTSLAQDEFDIVGLSNLAERGGILGLSLLLIAFLMYVFLKRTDRQSRSELLSTDSTAQSLQSTFRILESNTAATIDSFKQQIAAQDSRVQEQDKRIRELEARVAGMEETLAQKDQTIQAQTTGIIQLKQVNADMQVELAKVTTERDLLKEEKRQWQMDRMALIKQIANPRSLDDTLPVGDEPPGEPAPPPEDNTSNGNDNDNQTTEDEAA